MAPSEFRNPNLFCAFLLCCPFFLGTPIHAQQQPAQAPGKQTELQTPAQIELLETKIRFETNGDSRKEVHTRVKINSELGVRQFARLNFDYNRSFESIDLPLVRITHPSGGTVDILPSAITDNPNPAVVNAPAYQDVRVKSVRILGLAPGDLLEYRVITTVSHHPLAPDFWLDHSFDRSGVVSQEIFELNLPTSAFEQAPAPTIEPSATDPAAVTPPGASTWPSPVRPAGHIFVSPMAPPTSKEKIAEEQGSRLVYKWHLPSANQSSPIANPALGKPENSDLVVTTFASWSQLSKALRRFFSCPASTEIWTESLKIVRPGRPNSLPPEPIYKFVSQEVATVDLPFDTAWFPCRSPSETLSSKHGIAKDKANLLKAMLDPHRLSYKTLLLIPVKTPETQLPRPSLFTHILLEIKRYDGRQTYYLDPSMEVAPFGVISADLRGKKTLDIWQCPLDEAQCWTTIPDALPFASVQHVAVDAAIAADGKLSAKVHYSLRGDNELLLRVAFHQAPREKWKDLAQLLSLSDGFRGKVTSVTASDPSATRDPFTLDYEITVPKFADWSKKPVRIPALLPQIGLPDPPAKPSPGAAASPIELGTPLEVETHMTLHLPPGTTTQTPTGTSIQRDYATFASQYSAKGPTITASRHIHFLLRQVSVERAPDYNAFLRAVQNDEAQDFALDYTVSSAPDVKPAASAAHPLSTPKP